MPIGPIRDNFQAYSEYYRGAGVSGYSVVPKGARRLILHVIGPGGNGGNGDAVGGGGGGGGGGASRTDYDLTPADAGVTVAYNVGAVAGENSYITTTLEAYGAVSVLCSSGVTGDTGLSGGLGGIGGNGTGADLNYTGTAGQDGSPAIDTGFGGIGGAASYKIGADTSTGKGGRGGNSPANAGRTNGKTGLIFFEWT